MKVMDSNPNGLGLLKTIAAQTQGRPVIGQARAVLSSTIWFYDRYNGLILKPTLTSPMQRIHFPLNW